MTDTNTQPTSKAPSHVAYQVRDRKGGNSFQRMPRIGSRAPVREQVISHHSQPEGFVQFPVSQQTRIRGNLRTVKLQPQAAIKT